MRDMRRHFVGALLVREERVLLVRSRPEASHLEQMWSLPVGEIRESESSEQALVRVIADTTGFDVHETQFILLHEGATSTLSLFEARFANDCPVQNRISVEHEFIALDDLPQQINLSSLLCIAKYQVIRSKLVGHPCGIIDRLFTSIFYTYLAPHLTYFDDADDILLYKHIVLSTPFRKFKSVVPFLLSTCDSNKWHLFLIPELCFAVWTLLDDCHDETLSRYGQPSVLQAFGRRESVIALFRSLNVMTGILEAELSASNAMRTISALRRSASMLHQRTQNTLDIDLDDYLDQSASRTEFLRAVWVGVLEEAEYDASKREIVHKIQERSSRIGQLINDYFDIERGQLRDFDQRTASAHWLLLKDRVQGDDSALLRQMWARRQTEKAQYLLLLGKYDIGRELGTMIKEALVDMINDINASDLEEDEKSILIAWHQMSFVQFHPEMRDPSLVSSFLKSVESLLVQRNLDLITATPRDTLQRL